MMVYNNHFEGKGFEDIRSIQNVYRDWISRKLKRGLSTEEVITDGLLRVARGTLETVSSGKLDELKDYAWSASLSHSDSSVSGRLWITEFGVRWSAESKKLDITVSLRTNEISARVNEAVQVTRPVLVQMLLDEDLISSSNAGTRLKTLNNESLRFIEEEIYYDERSYAIVLVSRNSNGDTHIDPLRLLSKVVGLADVIIIDNDIDQVKYSSAIPKRFVARNGSISIIFKKRPGLYGDFIESVALTNDNLLKMDFDSDLIEGFILSALAHRYNLPKSWLHVSPSTVKSLKYQQKLDSLLLERSGESDLNIYKELLEMASARELQDAENIRRLEEELDNAQSEAREKAARANAFEESLIALKQSESKIDGNSIVSLFKSSNVSMSLADQLKLLEIIFQDRIVVLDSAVKSAKASDKAGFKYCDRSIKLLVRLCEDYWHCLVSGQSDSQARTAFGKNEYSAKEAETISTAGLKRRTFKYNGSEMEMLKHLKIGVGDNAVETLRIHFAWISDERKIIIGHCGAHLDF